MSKLAIFFPGMGYTHDKPLLYYSRKLAVERGYETVCVNYRDLPGKIRGDRDKMIMAAGMAYEQTCEQLSNISFDDYEEVVFIGKSIGTVVATRYAKEHGLHARMVLYTPVEATFAVEVNDAIAFIGEEDPWSNLDIVKELASKQSVPLYTYPGCNHSLEQTTDTLENINVLGKVMRLTHDFLNNK